MAVKYKTQKGVPIKPMAAPPDRPTESNGRPSDANGRPDGVESAMFTEQGYPGLDAWSGFIYQAYNADLYWPDVYELYNRLRRSDPEVSITRQIFGTVGASVKIEPDLPENPSEDDKRFQQLYAEVIQDLEGGIARWKDTFISYVPFMGWAWWEAVPGVRRQNWIPPDDDPWRSKYDDGLIGFRRFGFRDHSSFDSWKMSDRSGRLAGMWQMASPYPRVFLPVENSIHVAFGDVDNPEGLTPLEAIWRLERIKYGLEIVQGIGFEHAAGFLSVTKTSEGALTDGDKANVKAAARAILTAQEGNYAAWPFGFAGAVIDVPFSAAPSILAAIQHYSMLKLALYNMQWVAMSTVSATGSYAALKDSTALWLVAFNNMMSNGVSQMDEQIGPRLLKMNAASFPGITRRPMLKASKVEKLVDLQDIAQFVQALGWTIPQGPEDQIAIRRKTDWLPEALPVTPAAPSPEPITAGNLSALIKEVQAARRDLNRSR